MEAYQHGVYEFAYMFSALCDELLCLLTEFCLPAFSGRSEVRTTLLKLLLHKVMALLLILLEEVMALALVFHKEGATLLRSTASHKRATLLLILLEQILAFLLVFLKQIMTFLYVSRVRTRRKRLMLGRGTAGTSRSAFLSVYRKRYEREQGDECGKCLMHGYN